MDELSKHDMGFVELFVRSFLIRWVVGSYHGEEFNAHRQYQSEGKIKQVAHTHKFDKEKESL